jgi:hypothetical protein
LLPNSSKRNEEDKKDDENDKNDISIIELKVSSDVKIICDILKTFKEAKRYP